MSTSNDENRIADGRYTARALSATSFAANSGTKGLDVTWQIKDGPTFRDAMWLSDKAIAAKGGTFEKLRTAGWEGSDVLNVSFRKDRWVTIKVVNEPDRDGVMRPRVRFVDPIGGGAKPMDPAVSAAFAESMKAKLAAFDARRASEAAATGASTPLGDAPFSSEGLSPEDDAQPYG